MFRAPRLFALLATLALFIAGPALASGDAPHLDGAVLGLAWAWPFAGMLLSIAVLPLVWPGLWRRHSGKVAVFWALAALFPLAVTQGMALALFAFLHTMLLEYLPFLILLLTLFTVAGGVRLTGTLSGTPRVNTLILLVGTVLAGWMGTTGAAMLLIRPLLQANALRRYRAHSVVFFIFLVANIGGALTPLGDPPLFLGFLQGVSFFWPFTHLLTQTLFLAGTLLALYFGLDTWLFAREGRPQGPGADQPAERLGLEGGINLILLLGVVAAVLGSGLWTPDAGLTLFSVRLPAQGLVRDALLLAFCWLSLRLTPARVRRDNDFSWEPMIEVGTLFFGIFASMIPAMAMLQAGTSGTLAGVVGLVTHGGQPVNALYFWLTGLLSSFLDNAPTYLVFFHTAGGDAQQLMREAPATLAAISSGAVFMGANSYIGNAPNFMVRSMAEGQGVPMPSFFGYLAWSGAILLPLFGLITLIFY